MSSTIEAGTPADHRPLSSLQIAEAADHAAAEAMDKYVIVKAALYTSGERDPREPPEHPDARGKLHLMGPDPRLPRMPDKPTLFDFFKYRFGPCTHMLQSARLAQKNGIEEKLVLACLLHDVANAGFIRADHGYWAAQLVEPYVDEEVTFAIRYHQVLRFYPDESVGYEYPQSYVRLFGAHYRPEPYLDRAYEYCRAHKWYMSARMVTVNDLYAFDPNVHVELEEFTDIVGRHFRQPNEGLGFDDSPSAHMWRTINWPTRYLQLFETAPELCIDVTSPSNSRKELTEKVEALLAAGALEVWIVYSRAKRIEAFGREGLLEHSRLALDLAGLFD